MFEVDNHQHMRPPLPHHIVVVVFRVVVIVMVAANTYKQHHLPLYDQSRLNAALALIVIHVRVHRVL